MDFHQLIFLDIETVPLVQNYTELNDRQSKIWNKKSQYLPDKKPQDHYLEKAGIFAEFAKIVTISIGILVKKETTLELRLTSFTNHEEDILLKEFLAFLELKFDPNKIHFCAHNGKEFDYPFMCRRLLINGFQLPKPLKLSNMKPWEIPHLDTLEMWKFGDYKNYTSLETLAMVFDIPTSKDDIDGSQVKDVYYKEKDLPRIEKYCQKDVEVTARVYLSLQGFDHDMIKDVVVIDR